MLINLAPNIRNFSQQNTYSLIEELEKRRNYKPKVHPPEVIRYALLLRYTSLQSYKLLLQKFPLPSIFLLNKLQQGGVDAFKAVEIFREKGEISDVILMADEMYLQKCTQFHGVEYIGADAEGNLYKGVVVFMTQDLKKSISFVIKALPETEITGEWLAQHISECISCLSRVGFNVRAVVTDNHASNVNAFNCLLYTYVTNDSKLFIQHPDNNTKTYLFFDNVHLMENVCNNLFNAKKFVSPSFTFNVQGVVINSPDGYIYHGQICIRFMTKIQNYQLI